MVSKRDLGVSYLLAVGVGLFGALTAGYLLPPGTGGVDLGPDVALGIFSGLIVAGGFTLTGLGLANSDLGEERIWRVAQWATIGLGVPSLLAVLVMLFYRQALEGLGWRSVVVLNVAGGGVVGILVGTITELRAEHDRATTLNQRNAVFLRLFRHDIRNSVNLIQGHLDRLGPDRPPSPESLEIVRDQADHVLRLSDAARRLEELESGASTRPVDLAGVVADRVDQVREAHPEADVETDVPPEAYVRADDLLASVVDNLLTNAIEHGHDRPRVRVAVESAETPGRSVELSVRDDGPGFSEDELAVHSRAIETALRHSDGVGLWLARWIVDSYDGEFAVANAPDGGAVVTVTLPSARPPPADG